MIIKLLRNIQKQTNETNDSIQDNKNFAEIEILKRNQTEILQMRNSIC